MVNFALGPFCLPGFPLWRGMFAVEESGGGVARGAEEFDSLDLLLAAWELLPDRKAVLARITRGGRVSAKRGRNRQQEFVARVARPYSSGVPKPLFASEYPVHWPRFKALWDRLPVEKRDEIAG